MDTPPSRPFPRWIFGLALALTLLVIGGMGGMVLHFYDQARQAHQRSHRLIELRGQILLFDEALTMSARMGAATGAFRWERRYNEYEARLDWALNAALEAAPSLAEARSLRQTEEANRWLVAMERAAFILVHLGRPEQAQNLLLSPAYQQAKAAYAAGMGKLQSRIQRAERRIGLEESKSFRRMIGLGGLGVVLLALTWGVAFRSLYRWRKDRAFLQERLLQNLGEGVFGVDASGRFTFINPAALELLGYDDEAQVLGENSHRLTHHTDAEGRPYPEAECPIFQVMQHGVPLEAWQDRFYRRNGSSFPVEVYATPLLREQGSVYGGVVIFRDISTRKDLEERLRYLAHHDPLTGLYNRSAFEARLDEEHHRAERYDTAFSLVMFDLDHFKTVNDRFGHEVGDQVLRDIARLSGEELRASDTVGRWGGEEFMVLLPETEAEQARALAERLRIRVAEHPFEGPGRVTLSLSVAAYVPGEARGDLLKRLDDALYRAKETGRNRVVTAPAPTESRIPPG